MFLKCKGFFLQYGLINIISKNKTFLFFKIVSWNFQYLFEIEFRKTSQNFNSFSLFRAVNIFQYVNTGKYCFILQIQCLT